MADLSDAHSRPAPGPEELLYDADVATPTHGDRARTLVDAIGTGTLCTVAKEPAGFPYGSFVTFAIEDGNPIFFISTMAEHTKNLLDDDRASLLVAEGGGDDPLANGRVTMLGRCVRLARGTEDGSAREAYLAKHPNAQYYVDYKDFSFWRLDVESVRYIGGYGRMSWVETPDWRAGVVDPVAEHAQRVIDHMNEDHADALVSYCRAFTKAKDATQVQMTGIDRLGFEMSVETDQGPRPARLAFDEPITDAQSARVALVDMLGRARAVLGE